jgi:hypothetical protein
MSERDEQAALFQWAAYQTNVMPELAMLFAIPNGQFRKGQRPEPGLIPGVPDVFLAWPMDGYHGLFLEMKYGRNKPTQEQYQWINQLRNAGYQVRVCYSFEDAQVTIANYLSGNNPRVIPATIEESYLAFLEETSEGD